MALWVCAGEQGCGTRYAVGLFRCPRCHNTEFYEDGDPMAKITRHSGASDKTLPVPAANPSEDAAPADGRPEAEGGGESFPGTNSSTSTETQQQSSEPSSKPRRKPARTTESPSEPGQTESSSAPSTAGEKTTATSATDSASD